jgi:hypothetical protein
VKTMPWTWAEIENDWLIGSRLALPPQAVVDAFNRVERVFGRDWIETSRLNQGSPVQGTSPTLHVIIKAHEVAALDGLAGAERLLDLLHQNDPAAGAEATAIHLLRTARPDIVVELYQSIWVGERLRQPDFRVREPGGAWAYVEVTQPDASEAQQRVEAVMGRVAGPLRDLKRSFALEVFLRREPTDDEVEALVRQLPSFCSLDGAQVEGLPDGLGLLLLNQSRPGEVVLRDQPGEAAFPRLCRTRVIGGSTEPHRHIIVRLAYADERAVRFLEAEAKQLPREHPGLIMIQMGRAPGGVRAWGPLLRRRFERGFHTRVGAVCLFEGGMEGTPDGEAWAPRTKWVVNPHAALPLPSWINQALQSFLPANGSEAEVITPTR